ncbi:MAG: sarcosine oxidase subunit gamma [Pseudomonadota bacterium]
MPNSVSPLGGRSSSGFATVAEAGPCGMITVRGNLSSPAMAAAVRAAAGCEVPAQRRILLSGGKGAAWMSPDELLLLVPYAETPAAVAALSAALAAEHALVVDVSDARAVFTVTGAKADQVIRKLSPADIDGMAEDEIRRTRVAQVAGAFWRSAPDQITLVTFRSVAGYVMGVLSTAAREGTELA